MCWEERKGGSDPTKKRAFLWERRKERRSARASCSSPRGEASGRTRRAARARQRATDARPGEPLTMEGVVSQRDKSSKQSLSVTTLKRPRSIISQFQTTMLTILIQFDAIRFQSNCGRPRVISRGLMSKREEERVRRQCRERKCVGERQGMCVLGSKGCVCVRLPRRKSA